MALRLTLSGNESIRVRVVNTEVPVERRDAAAGAEDSGVMLGLLSAIERDSGITQRHIARELGIALGLTNAYLRRCATKGLIKIRQAPLNRYAYYLTPRGFAEKSRLTAVYLTYSLDFFRRARRDCAAVLAACDARGWRRLVLVGTGDLAEIAVLSATETGVEIVAIIGGEGERCAGRPVVRELSSVGGAALDALIVTDTSAPQARFEEMLAAAAERSLPAERVLAPELLRISARPRRNGKGGAS
ncbi:MAG TPA: winged helix-turn-helix transcriptional regulator [Stellaceae bacterium]|nr:winged helix-turn-helix transcriptional regulator [Stellaceae bacterium]